jgi:hypothetical protein
MVSTKEKSELDKNLQTTAPSTQESKKRLDDLLFNLSNQDGDFHLIDPKDRFSFTSDFR